MPRVGGGAEGNRTPDLRIANATLSHLSYGPTKTGAKGSSGRAEYEETIRPCQAQEVLTKRIQ